MLYMSDALFVIIILAVILGISGFGSALKEVDKEEAKRKRQKRRLLSFDIEHIKMEYKEGKTNDKSDSEKPNNEELEQ